MKKCSVCSLLPLVLVCGSGPAIAAQQPAQSPDEGGYVIHQDVRRVILDVVVTDNQGHPVHGLGRGDFSVVENGVKQQTRSFEPHELTQGGGFVPPKLPALPANTFVNIPNSPEQGPLYVIVYDAVDTDVADQPYARQQLKDFIAGKPPGTQIAIFLWDKGVHLIQGFTSDTNELLQVFDVKRKNGHIPYMFLFGDNYDKGDFGGPYDVITFVSQYLQGLPGRKILVWMSTGFPSSVSALMTSEMTDSQPNLQIGQGFTGAEAGVLPDQSKQMVDALTAARVSIYPIGVHGLDPGTHGMDRTQDAIATATGGHAFSNSNSNDIKGVLQQIAEDGSNYYEISYAPADPSYDGKKRKVEVVLKKKGYHLSYRRFYYADNPSIQWLDPEEAKLVKSLPAREVASKRGDTLYAYMQRGAPKAHEILFAAHAAAVGPMVKATPEQMANLIDQPAYFRAGHRRKPDHPLPPVRLQTYAIDYNVLDAEFLSRIRSGAAHPLLQFAVAAYNEDGVILNGLAQFAEAPAGDPKQKPFFRARQTLDVPESAAWMRLAVRDPTTNHIGTMEFALPLPSDTTNRAEAATRN